MTTVPEPLQPFVAGLAWTRITVGESKSAVFRLDRSGQAALYLKVAPKAHRLELLWEQKRLDWLRGRLSVPGVVGYEADDRNEYLLLTAVPGRHTADLTGAESRTRRIVQLLATGLRAIHAVPIRDCPFDMTLDREIERARRNVINGLVDEAGFAGTRRGRAAAELLAELQHKRPADEDLVFTHGDYCLPNVLVERGAVSGFVDWGRAGVADRYKDIALVVRSLERNTEETSRWRSPGRTVSRARTPRRSSTTNSWTNSGRTEGGVRCAVSRRFPLIHHSYFNPAHVGAPTRRLFLT